jgi:exodeoxyribonuclease VII large subunit
MAQRTVYSIGEVTAYIKARFEEDALLGDVWLSGEVSNFKQHTSGHCYLTLKDANASIKAVIWRTAAARLPLPRDGDAVIAHGAVSVYEPQGAYQLYIDHLEPAGAGRLWLEFERLRARLEAEGLFAAERKRPLPPIPARIGVVTSETGAALRDIVRILSTRYPLAEVLLAPAQVQGATAPPTIIAAIALLNRWSVEREPLDAIILARGGGSIEDLWPFNDEGVARAIAGSRVPIVTGVGHETDFTIADFVADLRAPTPTGAAASVTPDVRELATAVAGLAAAAAVNAAGRTANARAGVGVLARRATRASPSGGLARDRQRVTTSSGARTLPPLAGCAPSASDWRARGCAWRPWTPRGFWRAATPSSRLRRPARSCAPRTRFRRATTCASAWPTAPLMPWWAALRPLRIDFVRRCHDRRDRTDL